MSARMFEVRLDPELQRQNILHGYMPLTEAKTLLSKEGDYLLRLTDYKGQFICVLSAYHNGKVVTVCVNRKDMLYYFNSDHKYNKVGSLLDWHRSTKTPLEGKKVVLEQPIGFAPWNLQPTNVVLLLGDIYGCYRMKAYEIVIRVGKERIHAAAVLLTTKQLSVESKKQFMAEARTLKELSHPNILEFYGVIVTAVPLTMIVGLCEINLLVLLQKKEIRKDHKVRFAAEAAAALKYLTAKGYVHKDVQATNCLITRNLTVKLANLRFAASKRCPPFIHMEPIEEINTRWLAPEIMLRHIFTKETDVWAFGILLWEIYADGDLPYRGLSNMEIRSYVIHSKKRLQIPMAPTKVKKLMARCWEENPSRRPTFQEIEFTLNSIKKNEL